MSANIAGLGTSRRFAHRVTLNLVNRHYAYQARGILATARLAQRSGSSFLPANRREHFDRVPILTQAIQSITPIEIIRRHRSRCSSATTPIKNDFMPVLMGQRAGLRLVTPKRPLRDRSEYSQVRQRDVEKDGDDPELAYESVTLAKRRCFSHRSELSEPGFHSELADQDIGLAVSRLNHAFFSSHRNSVSCRICSSTGLTI